MKIIDNKKDYYDYLSGVYGIDDKVVYDRRGSIPSIEIVDPHKMGKLNENQFFTKRILDYSKLESYDKPVPFYEGKYYKKYYSYYTSRIVVEAGYAHYYIKVERYRIKKEDPITIKYTGMTEEEYWKNKMSEIDSKLKWRIKGMESDKQTATKKISDAPLCIAFYDECANSWSRRNTPTIYKNPILKDISGIAGCVDPKWIWQNIYDYISSLNDKPIIDNRTDIQHLESAGFDKKTSFRNVK